jgi:hypothetical protein
VNRVSPKGTSYRQNEPAVAKRDHLVQVARCYLPAGLRRPDARARLQRVPIERHTRKQQSRRLTRLIPHAFLGRGFNPVQPRPRKACDVQSKAALSGSAGTDVLVGLRRWDGSIPLRLLEARERGGRSSRHTPCYLSRYAR